MTICPLITIAAMMGNISDPDTSCMEDDCGFFSMRCDRCSIGVLGDMADRINNKY